MGNSTNKQSYSPGQIFGMIGIVIFLSPIFFRGCLLLFSVPTILLGLIKFDPLLKLRIFYTLWPINIGASLYATIWICAKIWPKRKVTQIQNS